MAEPDVEQVYEEFWQNIVERPDGTLDVDQVKRELFDYHAMLREVPKVYCHITGGRISKPNTDASAVCGMADEVQEERFQDLVKDLT